MNKLPRLATIGRIKTMLIPATPAVSQLVTSLMCWLTEMLVAAGAHVCPTTWDVLKLLVL